MLKKTSHTKAEKDFTDQTLSCALFVSEEFCNDRDISLKDASEIPFHSLLRFDLCLISGVV